jgi:hypothetical protein
MKKNTEHCGKCKNYYVHFRRDNKGDKKELLTAHCLATTIYARNRPDNPVFPPGANLKDMPYGRHEVTIVRRDMVKLNCQHFQPADEVIERN